MKKKMKNATKSMQNKELLREIISGLFTYFTEITLDSVSRPD